MKKKYFLLKIEFYIEPFMPSELVLIGKFSFYMRNIKLLM